MYVHAKLNFVLEMERRTFDSVQPIDRAVPSVQEYQASQGIEIGVIQSFLPLNSSTKNSVKEINIKNQGKDVMLHSSLQCNSSSDETVQSVKGVQIKQEDEDGTVHVHTLLPWNTKLKETLQQVKGVQIKQQPRDGTMHASTLMLLNTSSSETVQPAAGVQIKQEAEDGAVDTLLPLISSSQVPIESNKELLTEHDAEDVSLQSQYLIGEKIPSFIEVIIKEEKEDHSTTNDGISDETHLSTKVYIKQEPSEESVASIVPSSNQGKDGYLPPAHPTSEGKFKEKPSKELPFDNEDTSIHCTRIQSGPTFHTGDVYRQQCDFGGPMELSTAMKRSNSPNSFLEIGVDEKEDASSCYNPPKRQKLGPLCEPENINQDFSVEAEDVTVPRSMKKPNMYEMNVGQNIGACKNPVQLKKLQQKVSSVNVVNIRGKDIMYTKHEGHIYVSCEILGKIGISTHSGYRKIDGLLEQIPCRKLADFLLYGKKKREWILKESLIFLLKNYSTYRQGIKNSVIRMVSNLRFEQSTCEERQDEYTCKNNLEKHTCKCICKSDHPHSTIFMGNKHVRALSKEGEVFIYFYDVLNRIKVRQHVKKQGWKCIDRCLEKNGIDVQSSYVSVCSRLNKKTREFISRKALIVLLNHLKTGNKLEKESCLKEIERFNALTLAKCPRPTDKEQQATYPMSDEVQPATHPVSEGKDEVKPATHSMSESKNKEQPATHPVSEGKNEEQPATHPVSEGKDEVQPATHPVSEGKDEVQPATHPVSEGKDEVQSATHPVSEGKNKEQPATHPTSEGKNKEQLATHHTCMSEGIYKVQPVTHPLSEGIDKEWPSSQNPFKNEDATIHCPRIQNEPTFYTGNVSCQQCDFGRPMELSTAMKRSNSSNSFLEIGVDEKEDASSCYSVPFNPPKRQKLGPLCEPESINHDFSVEGEDVTVPRSMKKQNMYEMNVGQNIGACKNPVQLKKLQDKISPLNFVNIHGMDIAYTKYDGHIYVSCKILMTCGINIQKRGYKKIDGFLEQFPSRTLADFLCNGKAHRKWILKESLFFLLSNYSKKWQGINNSVIRIISNLRLEQSTCEERQDEYTCKKNLEKPEQDHPHSTIFIGNKHVRALSKEGEIFVYFPDVIDSIKARENIKNHGWKHIDNCLEKNGINVQSSYFTVHSKSKKKQREFISLKALVVFLSKVRMGHKLERKSCLKEIHQEVERLAALSLAKYPRHTTILDEISQKDEGMPNGSMDPSY